MVHDLPPIEQWWPTLPIALKHRVQEDLDAPLDTAVISAIRGDEAPEGYDVIRLTPGEQRFVREQGEAVD